MLRLGLDNEGLGEVIVVTELFNGMNRIADGYQVELEVKPPQE